MKNSSIRVADAISSSNRGMNPANGPTRTIPAKGSGEGEPVIAADAIASPADGQAAAAASVLRVPAANGTVTVLVNPEIRRHSYDPYHFGRGCADRHDRHRTAAVLFRQFRAHRDFPHHFHPRPGTLGSVA